jgi:hypothetical protein
VNGRELGCSREGPRALPAAKADRARLLESSWLPYRAWPPAGRYKHPLGAHFPQVVPTSLQVCPPLSSTSSILMTPRTAKDKQYHIYEAWSILLQLPCLHMASRAILRECQRTAMRPSSLALQSYGNRFRHGGAVTGNSVRMSMLNRGLNPSKKNSVPCEWHQPVTRHRPYQSHSQAPLACGLHSPVARHAVRYQLRQVPTPTR